MGQSKWQHAKRIDFVAVPFQELYKCTETFTGLGIDLNFHSADHSLTGVSMHWLDQCPLQAGSRKQVGLDKSELLKPEVLGSALKACQHPPWDADIASHHFIVNKQIRDCMHRAAPSKPQGPKKSFITPEIWQMRADLNIMRRRCREQRQSLAKRLLAVCFQAWASPRLDFGMQVTVTGLVFSHKLLVFTARPDS